VHKKTQKHKAKTEFPTTTLSEINKKA